MKSPVFPSSRQTELYLEIDSEESEDWNKIQHVIDTLRVVDLCPTDSVEQNISSSFLGEL